MWALLGDGVVVGLVIDDDGQLVRADAPSACRFRHTAPLGDTIGYRVTVAAFVGYRAAPVHMGRHLRAVA